MKIDKHKNKWYTNNMKITIQKTPNGRYRAIAKDTDSGYGLAHRAWGDTKAQAKANLLNTLVK